MQNNIRQSIVNAERHDSQRKLKAAELLHLNKSMMSNLK